MDAVDGRARADLTTFRRTTTVAIDIAASRDVVWRLLTDAPGFPTWNSTVTSIEGPIAAGQKLKIAVPISKRTFTPKVTAFEAPSAMTWSDGAKPMFWGVRDFTLTALADGGTRFTMSETIRGVMLPMAARSLPDFVPVFEHYAADLKAQAERVAGAGA